jgi:pimeloyl-ACP methyl ester carboxylesterase
MGPLPYAAVGDGPPLVSLAGLSPTTGFEGDGMVRATLGPLAALARTRRVVLFNRRPGLPRGMTMAALAAEHADAIRAGLGGPVDVVGTSTGGSIAQQLAAEHPDAVARLSSSARPAGSARSARACSAGWPPACGPARMPRRWPWAPRRSSHRGAGSSPPAWPAGCSGGA